MVSVPTSLGEWIHSPWFDLGLVVWKGYRPSVRLVLAGGHASAWISPFWRGPAPGAQRYQAVLFQQPAVYVAGHALQANLRERTFPDRRVRKRVPPEDQDEHQRAIRALHQRAIAQQAANPVSFALTNEWNDTITSDKKHHLEHFMRGTT